MIPLKNMMARRSVPVVTILLIVVDVLVFCYQLSLSNAANDAFIRTFGMVPLKMKLALAGSHYTLLEAFVPLITCMFLHGGFLHILGNMWFLWIFGGATEDRLGSISYLLFYFICGIGSGLAQALFSWGSSLPSIGASGAISGVLGAYVVFFPSSRILTLVPLFVFFFTAQIPAVIFIGLWFVVQFLSGVSALNAPHGASMGGVAWWAHVGGFVLGALLAKVFEGGRRRADSYTYS
ncbi:MAG: rhomboid family intramembrane serine protease [Candidatus Acidiferrales bacterium]